MRIHSIVTTVALLLAVGLVFAGAARTIGVALAVPHMQDVATPTPPPPPTAGPTPTYGPAPTDESLTDTIDTPAEAIAIAYEADRALNLHWQEPWDTSTAASHPERFIVNRFPNLEAEAAAAGEPVTVTIAALNNAGSVWSVTVLGWINTPEEPDTHSEGATYVISARSGVIWVERQGLQFIPPTPTPIPTPTPWGNEPPPAR